MSTGAILTVLSNIPWGQVVDNAPKLAEGAGKLWNSVTGLRKKTTGEVQEPVNAPTETEVLRSQMQALDETVKNLSDQMRASSELIKALADQNTQLVQRIELHRVRLLRVSVVAAMTGILLVAAVAFIALR